MSLLEAPTVYNNRSNEVVFPRGLSSYVRVEGDMLRRSNHILTIPKRLLPFG